VAEPTGGRQLSRRDLEVVIRRAAELETQSGGDHPELSEDDVVRIAGEVGLSEASTRRALAEHFASGGGLLADPGWLSRLCGPGLVTATRSIDRPAAELREVLESHFQTNESLRLVRRSHAGSLWEPDRGVLVSILRSVDPFGRGYQLAKKARAIELRLAPLAEATTQVTLTADLGNERAGWFWGLGVGVGLPIATGVGVGTAAISGVAPLAAAGLPLIAGTVAAARLGYARATDRMRVCLEGLLDRLEHGDSLEPPRTSWRDLLK
jgi:hypothetical protein